MAYLAGLLSGAKKRVSKNESVINDYKFVYL